MNKKLYVLSLVSTTFFLYVVSEHKVRSALLMNIIRERMAGTKGEFKQ
jgi:hypothetical protein